MRWLLPFLILLLLNSAAAIQISEIMYNPSGTGSTHEWLEIYNNESAEVNLTGWKFYEEGTNHGLILINGSWLLGIDKFAVIAEDANVFLLDYPNFNNTLFDSSFSLSDSGEYLVLKNSSLAVVENITYNSSWGANGDGNSLQLVNGNWCEGTPTPGLANSCASSPPPEEQHDLKLEVQIQNATENIQAKDLFKLTNLNPKTGQYVNAAVKFNVTINNNLEYESTFTAEFVQTKSTGTGTWTPQSAGTYKLCGEIINSSFADPNSSNNAACANIAVAENQNQSNNTVNNESQQTDFVVSILDLPEEVKQGYNFTARIELKNNFNVTKSVDVYSYVYSGSTLATEGGWTGNLQTINLTAGDSKVVNLTNNVKPDAVVGAYSFKARAVVDGKKYDTSSAINILENENITNATAGISQVQEKTEQSKTPNTNNNSTGSFVWQSSSTTINLAFWLFTAVLLIFVIVLLLTLLRNGRNVAGSV